MRWIEDLNDPVCSVCGSKENLTFGSDHYSDEIFGKKNPVW